MTEQMHRWYVCYGVRGEYVCSYISLWNWKYAAKQEKEREREQQQRS